MSDENAGESGQNGALLSDPVDVIIDKLLRYVDLVTIITDTWFPRSFSASSPPIALSLRFCVEFIGSACNHGDSARLDAQELNESVCFFLRSRYNRVISYGTGGRLSLACGLLCVD